MPITTSVEPFESVIKIVVQKSCTLKCDIKTTWENHMSNEEKQNISFDDFLDYLTNS